MKRTLKHRWRRHGRPEPRKELIEAAQEKWDKLDWQAIYNMIEGMPRRLNAVIDAEGGQTQY
jgi:hypothetical protein